MTLGSVVASNISLDACYGSSHSSVWASTIWLHLFVSNPTQGGAELTSAGGYAPVSITNNSTNFPDASGGQKTTGTAVTFTTSSGPWSGPADYWWFTDAQTALLAPGAPSVVTSGTPGSTPWYYKITTLGGDGETTGSGTGVVTSGNAMLSGSNYNAVSWTAVSGASSYNVYQSTDNTNFFLVGNTGSTSFHDTGSSPSPQTPPLSNTTMALLDGGTLSAPIIVSDVGYVVSFAAGSVVIAA